MQSLAYDNDAAVWCWLILLKIPLDETFRERYLRTAHLISRTDARIPLLDMLRRLSEALVENGNVGGPGFEEALHTINSYLGCNLSSENLRINRSQ